MKKPKNPKEIEDRTLLLQNAAMGAYSDYNGEDWESITSEQELSKGDTLALFIWREIGDAKGDPKEASRMMRRAIAEISEIRNKMDDVLWLPPFLNEHQQ